MQNTTIEIKRKFILDVLTQMKKEEYRFNFNQLNNDNKEIDKDNLSFISLRKKNLIYYFSIRKKLITIIKDIHNYLNFNKDTFYSSIYYMDILCNKLIEDSIENFETFDFKNLAISCIILSSKFTDNDPNIPNIKLYLYDKSKNNNQNVSNSDIENLKEFEIKCLNKLSYKLNYSNVFSFLKLFYCYGFVFKKDFEFFIDANKNKENNKDYNLKEDLFMDKFKTFVDYIYKKCDEIIYTITLDENLFIEDCSNFTNNNNYNEYCSFKISCGLIYYCRELFYNKIKEINLLDKNEKENQKDLYNNKDYEIWGNCLQNLYSIKFFEFEREYELIKA